MKRNKIQKTNALRLLEQLNAEYEVHQYEWSEGQSAAIDAAEKTSLPADKVFKTLVTVGDRNGVNVACIPADHTLNLKELAKVSGNKKMEMLPMKELEQTTGYIRGGCSPIGIKKQFPIFLSEEAIGKETIIVSAGKRGLQVELKPEALLNATGAKPAEISSPA